MNVAFFTHNDAYRPDNRIDYVFAKDRQAIIADLCTLHTGRITPSNFEAEVDQLQGLDAIFSTWGMFELTPAHLDRLPNLKAIFYAAGSVKDFAKPALERGIKVTTAAAANAIPVGEFCLAEILLACKGYFKNTALCREKIFKQNMVGKGVYGETVALLGVGAISRHLLHLLQPFNLRIIAVSNYLSKRPEQARALGIHELVSIEEAFEQAYIVSNHLPDIKQTKNILTDSHFRAMREGATFINTGRGQQVDEQALVQVMRERSDLTALLDVTYPEPPSPDSPLFTTPNIHLSAHIAGSQRDETLRMADYAIDEFRRFCQEQPLQHEVTRERLESMA